MSVAERGRLPAEVHEAYLAAHGGKAPAKARRPAPATKNARTTGQPPSTGAPAPFGQAEESAGAFGGTVGDMQKPGSVSAAEAAPELTSATRPRTMSRAEPAPVAKPALRARPQPTPRPRPTLPEPAADPGVSSHAEPAEPDRVAALVDELAALTARVAHLEQSASAVKPSRFRRRSS